MSVECPITYDHDEDTLDRCEVCGWEAEPAVIETKRGPETGLDRVRRAIERDRGMYAPDRPVLFAADNDAEGKS